MCLSEKTEAEKFVVGEVTRDWKFNQTVQTFTSARGDTVQVCTRCFSVSVGSSSDYYVKSEKFSAYILLLE